MTQALVQLFDEVRLLEHQLVRTVEVLHADLAVTAPRRAVLEYLHRHGPSTVPDIARAHEELQSRGVKFTHAPHMIHRHSDGTEEWMAFFEDPDGRPLAIMAQQSPAGGLRMPVGAP